MFTCYNCKQECRKLIYPTKGELCCEKCYNTPLQFKPGLHDVVAQNGQVKVTAGKAWEIRNRIKSPDDGRTCINRITGKPTQF